MLFFDIFGGAGKWGQHATVSKAYILLAVCDDSGVKKEAMTHNGTITKIEVLRKIMTSIPKYYNKTSFSLSNTVHEYKTTDIIGKGKRQRFCAKA